MRYLEGKQVCRTLGATNKLRTKWWTLVIHCIVALQHINHDPGTTVGFKSHSWLFEILRKL